jgi:hypothetical protein
MRFATNGTGEKMRIDSSGRLLVGKTAVDNTTVGFRFDGSSGFSSFVRDGGEPLYLNRKTSNGDMLKFAKDGAAAGSIGSELYNGDLYIGNNDTGVLFHDGNNAIQPFNPSTNGLRDSAITIGTADSRFKDLYLSGTVALKTEDNASAANMFVSPSTDFLYLEHPANGMIFRNTSGVERMRLTSDGSLLLGTTYTGFNSKQTISFSGSGAESIGLTLWTQSGSGSMFAHFVNNQGSRIGSITQNGTSAVAYNTSSDYRLKENVVDLTGASARVNQLNPSRFNWIADETNTLVDGFLAHEVATVVPEAINGTKDAMMDEEYEVTPAVLDDDGNVTTEAVMGTRSVPDYQGIDQSKLVPLLTAALQEALAKIDAMETRLTALEG